MSIYDASHNDFDNCVITSNFTKSIGCFWKVKYRILLLFFWRNFKLIEFFIISETVVVPAFALPLNTPLSYIREQIKERYVIENTPSFIIIMFKMKMKNQLWLRCACAVAGCDLIGRWLHTIFCWRWFDRSQWQSSFAASELENFIFCVILTQHAQTQKSFGCSCCKDASCCKSKSERSKCGPFSRISQYTCEAHRIGWYQQRAPCGKPLSHFDRHRAAVPYVEPFASADAMDACIYDTSALFNNIKLKTLYEPKWLYYMPDAMIVLKKFSHSLNSTEYVFIYLLFLLFWKILNSC